LSSGTSPARRGLGRGLEVLIGGAPPAELAQLPVDHVHPNPKQPRRRFDHETTAALAESVRSQGLVQPVVVRSRAAGGYELIAGERRWRAAREAGLETIPALVRETGDRDALLFGLVENVAREQLTPVEEARAYALLVDEFGLGLGEIAERVGRSKPAVSNRIRLLDLPDEVLAMLERSELTEGHARAVLAVPDQDERRLLARRIVRRRMSVRAAEQAARLAGARTKTRRSGAVDPALAERARTALRRITGRQGHVRATRIEIEFDGDTDLEELVELLERAARF
jgi:ParB family transcriptional regulator, chromosome partitioning protein